MELSPKQQTVEQIKKANRVLILGHKNPEGDLLGSGLALAKALTEIGKTAEIVVTEKIPAIYNFLPEIEKIKSEYKYTPGKVIKIDTKRFPVKGMKWQREDDLLNIYLESDKNLKFEYIEIENGQPKPDLIIVLDTPDIEKIDAIYNTNNELFFEVPVINIDHHSGNEYFGTVNLVDLTASSTAEILVSLFEALGIKISNPDIATGLLTGIIADTQSFRSAGTTPKSLTVAAQLLAAGGRQQEIISNLYKKRPMALLKLWNEMLSGLSIDKNHEFAWTKIKLSEVATEGLAVSDVLDSADEILSATPEAKIVLVLAEEKEGEVWGRLKAAKGADVLPLAKIFKGNGTTEEASFKVSGQSLKNAELNTLKEIHDYFAEQTGESGSAVWDVIDKATSDKRQVIRGPEELSTPTTEEEIQETSDLSTPQTLEEIQETTPVDEDPIDQALESISKEERELPRGFSSLKDVIEKKRQATGNKPQENEHGAGSLEHEADNDIDVFDEEE